MDEWRNMPFRGVDPRMASEVRCRFFSKGRRPFVGLVMTGFRPFGAQGVMCRYLGQRLSGIFFSLEWDLLLKRLLQLSHEIRRRRIRAQQLGDGFTHLVRENRVIQSHLGVVGYNVDRVGHCL